MASTVSLYTSVLGLSSPTVTIYPDGSDTAGSLAVNTATEAANRDGTYTFSNDAGTGLHLIHLISGSVVRWYGWAVLTTSGTVDAYDSRQEAIRAQVTGSTGVTTGDIAASVTGAVGSVTGNVGGNVVGSVGSVTGAVGSVTATVTVGTNNDKTGYSLTAGTGLGNQTADITGSLSGSVGSVTGAVGSVTGNVGGNVAGSVGSVLGGINTSSGTLTTLDQIDASQDIQHLVTLSYLTTNLGANGANATEAGGTGDHLTALATATELAKVPKSDGTVSFNATALAAINAEVDTALSDYDPPTNAEFEARTPSSTAIANVETVFNTDFANNYSTTNDGWRTYPAGYYDQGQASNQQFPNNFASLGINGSGHVSRVTLVDTTTTNTDMRGTDNAALATALATAQTDLDTLTGADGVTLATSQPNYAPATATALATVDTVVDGIKAVTDLLLTATGTVDNALADATTTVFKTDLVAINDFYNDQQLLITSGSLAGQVKPISDFAQTNGVITLAEGLTTAPDNGVTFAVLAFHVHAISQIQSGLATATALQTVDDEVGAIATSINSGNVVVASVTGAVGSVANPVTAGTVTDKTGYTLDSNQAFNNTGTFTGDINGNVTGSVDSVTSGVTLAASQPLYTPAVAGDAMALTSGERTTLAGVIWSTLTSALTAVGSIGKMIVDKLTPLTFTNANKVDASMLAADAATANKLADHSRRRTQANVEASADGDALSLGSEYGMIQMTQESNTTDNAGSITVYRTDGATELGRKTVATDATADPVTGVS